MDGKGRSMNNIFMERLWSNVKNEEMYLKNYDSVNDLITSLRVYFEFYNNAHSTRSLDMLPLCHTAEPKGGEDGEESQKGSNIQAESETRSFLRSYILYIKSLLSRKFVSRNI